MVAVVLIAALADTFILTGYLFYGAAIATAATAALLNGASYSSVFVAALFGTVIGELLNLAISRSNVIPSWLPRKVLEITGRPVLRHVLYRPEERAYIMALKFCALRFFAISRPLNIFLLEFTRGVKWLDFPLILLANAIWVLFWLTLFENALALSRSILS